MIVKYLVNTTKAAWETMLDYAADIFVESQEEEDLVVIKIPFPKYTSDAQDVVEEFVAECTEVITIGGDN